MILLDQPEVSDRQEHNNLARPYRQYAKDNLDQTCQRNNEILNYHLKRRPSNLKEFLSNNVGTNSKTLERMINEGTINAEEIEILDYYIWKIAAPLLKCENHKMQAEINVNEEICEDDTDD
jgi:hypothetical protein